MILMRQQTNKSSDACARHTLDCRRPFGIDQFESRLVVAVAVAASYDGQEDIVDVVGGYTRPA